MEVAFKYLTDLKAITQLLYFLYICTQRNIAKNSHRLVENLTHMKLLPPG